MSRTRRLIVMRHAKSSWASGAQSDHQRPLNDRGRCDAPRVATALVDANWLPDLILSSDAQRTRETYDGMAVSFPGEIPVQFLSSFYLSSCYSWSTPSFILPRMANISPTFAVFPNGSPKGDPGPLGDLLAQMGPL